MRVMAPVRGVRLSRRQSIDPGISMVTLDVSVLEKSVTFYDALGFPRLPSEPGIAFFGLRGTWLALYPRLATFALTAAISGLDYNSLKRRFFAEIATACYRRVRAYES
jgi:hypothetical protein